MVENTALTDRTWAKNYGCMRNKEREGGGEGWLARLLQQSRKKAHRILIPTGVMLHVQVQPMGNIAAACDIL